MSTFNLPDVGEGLTEAEIVGWKVKPGDTVVVNQVFVEIETAKSLVELPSPYAGVVKELHAAEGETLAVGAPLFSVDEVGSRPAPLTNVPQVADIAESDTPVASEEPGPLVGSGPKADAVKRRARTNRPAPAKPGKAAGAPGAPAIPAALADTISRRAAEIGQASTRLTAAAKPAVAAFVDRVLAKPPVRKVAKELGVDLTEVTGTGGQGEITRDDVISYKSQREAERDAAPMFWSSRGVERDERIVRTPVRGVRKATAKAMVDSAFTAPHVSIFVDVDASRTMEYVARLKKSRDFEGIRVSPLLVLAKAVIWAAARNPSVNASWVETENGAEIQVKHFMNLGIAAATPRGLIVPNVKEAQNLSMRELAIALNDLAETARAGKTSPADMSGGTLTVTNIGVLGIDTGTPIINPGEVAIVAFGTIRQKPWVVDGAVVPRWITTLGGSFDHRVVDGDLSARFMADVAAIMQEPALLLD
ncbi:dihydrolipoamide acetyltransferase family protein [Paeniglutamicibacter psychrophenolicus]|uniref:Dihydrolipoamide acetyltransferase component of pyruvate dehydrogenase complex n=1 Tax=Paeniglutamicibacter psychrophenolicus TaxID=257454 RepID=A0ABS4WAP6_9MICC|nr:dihydrolipoamide acetyltransferase family protein [Paeniglutamicibacter psychrophenolicus]MBP2373262.1 pyruvate dehydrogenase E2 component (dihydrolipoamide acetyltransferase) [Paeniglutamicibacter psychrophenolicus]